MVTQEQVLNRGYSFVLPGDKDHAVHSHSSRNKLLLLALRKIEPKLLASDEFRQRLYSMLGRKLLLWGATRLAKIMSGFSMR